jgi:branched-chain amino acid transport system ATP-binding protein
MDEPSEGLAPAVVDLLIEACIALESEGVRSLVIEQNLHVACALADDVMVMTNGRLVASIAATDFASNAELQHRYLGVASLED